MENNQFEKFIMAYVKAVDTQDVQSTASLMHPAFRVVMRHNKEQDKISILPKEIYLQLMEEKKVGGSERIVSVHSHNNFAGYTNVYLTLENEKMCMRSVFSLVSENGNFKIISDHVYITFK
ncbi:MAG: hypothetical protein K0S32_2079 [Bacteroidetes bacterium]|jgi:hypothetical protein|nr:hypothetical protein [Bacteroidota bacterium]